MKLLHYTARHHAEEILLAGAISKGGIPVPDASGEFLAGHVPGWQWLTDDATWRQSWATQISIRCDRTEVRLVVEIPLLELHRLKRWDAVAAEFGYPPDLARQFAQIGGGTDSSHWFVFRGPIPISWLLRLESRPSDVVVAGTRRSRKRAASREATG